jgi:hypothetical protein
MLSVRSAEGAFMWRRDSGTALTGPISGKPDIGDAVPADGGKRNPCARAARGTRKQVYAVCTNANCYAGDTMIPRQELADGVSLSRPCRKRGPRRKTPRWSAAGRAHPRRMRTHRKVRTKMVASHGALSPSMYVEGKGNTGEPGARQTTGAAERWLILRVIPGREP